MRSLLLGLVFWVVPSFGSEAMEIRELIEKVKRAPADERYKVMNELKLKLREMNRREREEAIRKIYMELKGEEYRERHEERYEREHEREEMMERYEEVHERKEEMMERRDRRKKRRYGEGT